jgi:hypothetical protein
MDFKQLSEQFEAIANENELLKESYSSMAQAMLAFEDKGWNTFGGMELAESFKLEELQRAAAVIRENSEANPLLKRGCGLRSSYIFGRGVTFAEQPPRIRKLVLEQQNQDVLFSSEAQAVNERSHFTDVSSLCLEMYPLRSSRELLLMKSVELSQTLMTQSKFATTAEAGLVTNKS